MLTLKNINIFVQAVKPYHVFGMHKKAATCVAVSGNSQVIASCGEDKFIQVWGHENREQTFLFRAHDQVLTSIDLNDHGTLLVSASCDKTVKLWSLQKEGRQWDLRRDTKQQNASKTLVPPLLKCLEGHTESVLAVKFSPNEHKIASCSEDQTVIIWSAKTFQRLVKFNQHQGEVLCLAWSLDSKKIATGGTEGNLMVWKPEPKSQTQVSLTSRLEATEVEYQALDNGYSSSTVLAVAFVNKQNSLVSAGTDSAIKMWAYNYSEKKYHRKGIIELEDAVASISVSPDSRFMACASEDEVIQIWSFDSYSEIQFESPKPVITLRNKRDGINSVVWAPSGGYIVAACEDQSVCQWDLEEQVCCHD